MNAVYITNGSKRKVKVGRRNIVFKNAVQKNFQYQGKLLPLIIIALKELGEKNVTDVVLEKIKLQIQDSNLDERIVCVHNEPFSIVCSWLSSEQEKTKIVRKTKKRQMFHFDI